MFNAKIKSKRKKAVAVKENIRIDSDSSNTLRNDSKIVSSLESSLISLSSAFVPPFSSSKQQCEITNWISSISSKHSSLGSFSSLDIQTQQPVFHLTVTPCIPKTIYIPSKCRSSNNTKLSKKCRDSIKKSISSSKKRRHYKQKQRLEELLLKWLPSSSNSLSFSEGNPKINYQSVAKNSTLHNIWMKKQSNDDSFEWRCAKNEQFETKHVPNYYQSIHLTDKKRSFSDAVLKGQGDCGNNKGNQMNLRKKNLRDENIEQEQKISTLVRDTDFTGLTKETLSDETSHASKICTRSLDDWINCIEYFYGMDDLVRCFVHKIELLHLVISMRKKKKNQ